MQVFERAAEVFSLLSASSRLRLLSALCDGELCVGDLAAAVDMPQPTASQHLSLLFRAGLLGRRREGAQVYYAIEPKTRDFLCRAVQSLVE
jgi:ArsR family transcriptional regulator